MKLQTALELVFHTSLTFSLSIASDKSIRQRSSKTILNMVITVVWLKMLNVPSYKLMLFKAGGL